MSLNTNVSGVIVYDLQTRSLKLVGYLTEDRFKDGVCFDDYHKYVLIDSISFEVEMPKNFDPLKPQLMALDHKEAEINKEYKAKIHHISVERSKLLAIEN